jgi:D-sedoheptulose 7-phosphate isomerase
MFSQKYLDLLVELIYKLDKNDEDKLEEMAFLLSEIKNKNGRIFFLGNGGSNSSASHAVNDFRKIVNIECYNITDNISEMSARINDDGFDSIFIEWLKTSKLSNNDAIFVLSVGGGNKDLCISKNIIYAIDYANLIGAKVFGIVGRDGGYTLSHGDCVLLIPTVDKNLITPFVESFHSIILHFLVSHPLLKSNQTKWESLYNNPVFK